MIETEAKITLRINDSTVVVGLNQGRIRPRVGCLGKAGTYTEAARYELLKDSLDHIDAEFISHNDLAVRMAEAGDYDLVVVPVENSIEGDVVEVLRAVNRTEYIRILAEEIIGIQHMLIGFSNTNLDAICSHPQALAQCSKYLWENYPEVKQSPTSSTTAAVEMARDCKQIAAIANRRAAQIYDVPILAQDIGDIKGNSTRFLLLGKGETEPTGQDSTTFIFIPKENGPGTLLKCLTELEDYNLTKIGSRPTGKEMGQYAFWVTMEGHYKDSSVQQCIHNLRDKYCESVRVLGSYKTALLPEGVKDPGAINGNK